MQNYKIKTSTLEEVAQVRDIIKGIQLPNILFVEGSDEVGFCLYYYSPVTNRVIFMVRKERDNDSLLMHMEHCWNVLPLEEISFSKFRSMSRVENIQKILNND